MGLEINKIPSNDTISWQNPTNVLQLKSEKGKEGRPRPKRSGRRKREGKKPQVTASKLINVYIKIYVRQLKDSNTKVSSQLNAGLEKA